MGMTKNLIVSLIVGTNDTFNSKNIELLLSPDVVYSVIAERGERGTNNFL